MIYSTATERNEELLLARLRDLSAAWIKLARHADPRQAESVAGPSSERIR
jgi:hypothetical protein